MKERLNTHQIVEKIVKLTEEGKKESDYMEALKLAFYLLDKNFNNGWEGPLLNLVIHACFKMRWPNLANLFLLKINKAHFAQKMYRYYDLAGRVASFNQEHELAEKHYLKALESLRENKVEEKSEDYQHSLGNLGNVYLINNQTDKALECYRKLEKLEPDNVSNNARIGFSLLRQGNYKEGFKYYDSRETVQQGEERILSQDGSKLPWYDFKEKGKTIVIHMEQGIGDELLFGQLIPEIAKDNQIILECDQRLQQLFQRAFFDKYKIPVYGTRHTNEIRWPLHYKIDCKLMIGSLPRRFWNKKEDIKGEPYLTADPKYDFYVDAVLKREKAKRHIGFSYAGGQIDTASKSRTIPLEKLIPLFDMPDTLFYNFYYHGNSIYDLEAFYEKYPKYKEKIIHCQEIIDDFDFSANLLSKLDCLVATPQSIVHLAGALGVDTYQLAPIRSLWQVGVQGESPPWHQCVQNIWQESYDDWDGVVGKLMENLNKKFDLGV